MVIASTALPNVDVVAQVKHKAVRFTKFACLDLHREDSRISFALHSEQFWHMGFGNVVLESRINATVEIFYSTLEVAQEKIGLLLLKLQVMVRGHLQVFRKLNSKGCCTTSLI